MLIVYQSFAGRYSDSPRALYEALRERAPGHRHVWLTDPAHAGGFPPEVETAGFGSPECVALLEAADLLVANTHTDLDWRKREDALYLQTWHGTPLKRIHHDVLWAPEGRLERLSLDVDRWDVLLSPNHFASGPLRGAFRYDGELLETGYPRNDRLLAPGREDERARVRADLGIEDGRTVVLYAPTWRDDAVFAGGGAELQLDVEAFTRELGDSHTLLLRLHPLVPAALPAMGDDRVLDVSSHPEIGELYLAADVLVTDYSSSMFDFAVTGKPLLFFTYDLADYRDSIRGFYFDFAPEAPGPLLADSADVIAALGELPAVAQRWAAPYARFRKRYGHLEDGHATERVLYRLALLDGLLPTQAR